MRVRVGTTRDDTGFEEEGRVVGAEVADGVDEIVKVVRRQIGRGADWIKIYAGMSVVLGAFKKDGLTRLPFALDLSFQTTRRTQAQLPSLLDSDLKASKSSPSRR